jgi:hypothetical protein
MAHPHRIPRGTEVERTVEQIAINGTDERSFVGRHGCDHQQSHALEELAHLMRAKATIVANDGSQVRASAQRALVKKFLKPFNLLECLIHLTVPAQLPTPQWFASMNKPLLVRRSRPNETVAPTKSSGHADDQGNVARAASPVAAVGLVGRHNSGPQCGRLFGRGETGAHWSAPSGHG